MSNEQKLREAFEKWAREQFYSGLACPSDTWSEDQKTYNAQAHHMAFCAFKAISQAIATTEPTSKQPLQVEPAVNQQLTTEPVDEREAFEKVFPTPSHCQRCGDGYAATSYNAWEAHNHIERWKGWQARAAMAMGVKG